MADDKAQMKELIRETLRELQAEQPDKLKPEPSEADSSTLEQLDNWIDPWVRRARESAWTPFYVGLFWWSGALFGWFANHYYHGFLMWLQGAAY